MSQLPPSDNNVLTRTIRNIEQAHGLSRHRATIGDVLERPVVEEPELVSLPSTSMAEPAEQSNMPPINLTLDLAASTTLLQNLRTRNSILVADLARATQSLIRRDEKATRLLLGERSSKAKWMVVALCLIAMWAAYLWWCWCMRIEFAYIRKRRGEVLEV